MDNVTTICVSYEARRCGALTDALSWGQHFIWDVIGRLSPNEGHLNLAVSVEIRGHDRRGVLDALARFIERHESLRTSYELGPGGTPRQLLSEFGELVLELVRCRTGECHLAAREARARLLGEPFDLKAGPPIRAAIIEEDEVPKHLVLIFSHIVADGVGRANLTRELTKDLATPGATSISEKPWQPQDQALWEQSEAGRAAQDQAIVYWRASLPSFPNSMFKSPMRSPDTPRWQNGTLRSEAIGLGARELARRHRVSPPSILIAAFGLLLAYRNGLDACSMMLHVANRFGGHDAERTFASIGTFVQPGPLHVKLNYTTFGEIVREVHSAALNTYVHSALSPLVVEELVRAESREPVRRIELDTTVNILPDILGRHLSVAEHQEAVKRILASPDIPVFTWEAPLIREIPKFLAYVELPNYVSLIGDTAHFGVHEFEPMLRALHRLLIETMRGEDNPWTILRGSTLLPVAGRGFISV